MRSAEDSVADLPINPDVIRWARETAGLSIEDVVEKMARKRIDSTTVLSWEEGTKSPTYPQLERLAYEIYKRPVAIFFFPEPPEEVSPKESFRTLPDYEIDLMPPRIRMLLRKARALQINLAELYDGVNPADSRIVKDLSFHPDTPATEIAESVRDYLSIDLSTQIGLQDSEQAFKFWRNRLEESGVSVFKDAFREDSFSGFCLYDDTFPLIYVNNSKPFTRQSFTLFHELAHLLFKTGGIDAPIEHYLDQLSGDDRLIEILCNKFAGELLVPSSDFEARTRGLSVDDQTIQNLANTYHVSREVVLRKFYDRNVVSGSYYNERVAAWRQAVKPRTPGGNYYRTMGAYLSEAYVDQAFSRYYQNRIGVEQLADYLGVKVKNVPGMEAQLTRKGAEA